MQGRSETFLRLFFLNKGDHTTAAYSRRGRISVLYSGVCVYGVRGRGGDPIDLSLIDLYSSYDKVIFASPYIPGALQ